MRISVDGGTQPRWSRDGTELFYLAADGSLMGVPIRSGTPLEAGTARALSQADIFTYGEFSLFRTNYDVADNGQRFLVNTAVRKPTSSPVAVVLNWPAALGRP